MYKNSFLYSCKKTIQPIFTKIIRVRPTVTYNIHTKFELNLMHRLDTIVFIHIHTDPVAEYFLAFCNKTHKYQISICKIIFNRVVQSTQYCSSHGHHRFFIFIDTQYSIKVILCAALIFNNNKRCVYELNIIIKYNKHAYKNATNILKILPQLIFEKWVA